MLEGTAALEEAVEVARTVDGVREVKTQQVEIPPIPPFVAYPPGLAGPSRFGLSSGTSATFAVTSIFCFFLRTLVDAPAWLLPAGLFTDDAVPVQQPECVVAVLSIRDSPGRHER